MVWQAGLYLIRKEFKQVFRDKAMIRIIFVLPIIQLFIFGYAVQSDLTNVRLAVLDQDVTPQSRQLTDEFFAAGLFIPVGFVNNPDELESYLVQGKADMTLWIPKNYAADISAGDPVSVGVAVNGSNATIAGRGAGYASALVRQTAERRMEEVIAKNNQIAHKRRAIQPVTRYYYNPELVSRFYMIPAIIVLLVTIISGMLTGMAIVREKEIGTLEQLMVSPLTPLQLIIGKTVPFALLSFFEVAFATTVAVLWFDIPIVGSIWLLALGISIYLLVTLGAGLLASTVSATQQQAMFTIWFLLTFGIMMSGFFFPLDNMPEWAQMVTYINPLRYVLEIVRGIFLKGATSNDLLPQLIPLLGLGLLIFVTAVFRFRKTIG